MLKKTFLLLALTISICTKAQQNPAVIDSLKLELAKATTSEEKVKVLSSLSRVLMNVNAQEADKYAAQMTQEAELSRNRGLITKALLINGERFSYFGTKDNIAKSISYYNQALKVARESKLDEEVAQSLLALSTMYMTIPDLDKSLSYTIQASSVTATLKNDSMQVLVYISFGNIYQLKKERLLSLRNYLNGLRLAEEAKNDELLRKSYKNLGSFYADIKEYDKAIDYAIKSLNKLSPSKSNWKYNKVIDLNDIGNFYSLKKNSEMSVYYYEQSIKLADSLKFEALKTVGYSSILNQYINGGQSQKALEYFNKTPDLKKYINLFGLPHIVDQAYAVIYTELGRFDSAKYYFDKAAPQFEAKAIPYNKLFFYYQFGNFYKRSGNNAKAIETYVKAKALADEIASLEWQEELAKNIDTIYTRLGDYQQSYRYNVLYYQYKDSLQQLGEEKDLMQMELADEQQRQDRITKEREADLNRRHNVQYTGITISIAVVFVLLVLLGIFQVSERAIKISGFFAFIFLFEFIILIADGKIHHWTHGEPLPILGIKVVLIALLLPLHHWLEHKVVSYLASKKLIIPSGKSFWTKILAKRAAKSVQ